VSNLLVIPRELVDGLLLSEVTVSADWQQRWGKHEVSGLRHRVSDWPTAGAFWLEHDADGPYPFMVAVWRSGKDDGAIVATAMVTGPSHHADDCQERDVDAEGRWSPGTSRHCRPGAASDGWHTSTGEVVRLKVPIPCERPTECSDCEGPCEVGDAHAADRFLVDTWWAPPRIAARLTGEIR
jgi:hypothetical protein